MSLQAVSGTGSASKGFAGRPRRGPSNGWVVSNTTSAGDLERSKNRRRAVFEATNEVGNPGWDAAGTALSDGEGVVEVVSAGAVEA